MKKRNKFKIMVTALAAVAIGTGSFFVGGTVASVRYKNEQEKNIMINRSDLDNLGKITGTIYI